MSNAAGSDRYVKRVKEAIKLFEKKNFENERSIEFSKPPKKYKIVIEDYAGTIGKYNYRGSICYFYDNEVMLKKWYCIDNSAAFYQLISHRNGKDYLIFRQDLYGYSVLDIESAELMQFFPDYSLDGGETFIWTQADYNIKSNVLAVSGCYWAWPYSVQLFLFDEPMNDNVKFIDIISCLEGDYDVYDELEFLKWEDEDLHLKAYLTDEKKTELVISQEEYESLLNGEKAKYL